MEEFAVRENATPELKALGPAYLKRPAPQIVRQNAGPKQKELGPPHLRIVNVLKPTAYTPRKRPDQLTHHFAVPAPARSQDNPHDDDWE